MGANEKLIYTESMAAAADLSAKQYYGMKSTADQTAGIMAAVTDVPAGVLLNDPDTAGKAALIMVIGRCPVVAAETLAAGDLIRFDDAGKAALCEPGTDTTAYIAGQVIEGADVDEYAIAMINCASPARAA